MSARRALVLLLAIPALSFLVACGGGGGSIVRTVPPPSGAFSNGSLNGTYVFSSSGFDASGGLFSMMGTLVANGSGGITGGTVTIMSSDSTVGMNPNQAISSASYKLGSDGRGQIQFNANVVGGGVTFVLDFVLSSPSHGLVTEFDAIGSGSGTIDLQPSAVAQGSLVGSYTFAVAGTGPSLSSSSFATVGSVTLDATGTATAGSEDINNGTTVAANQPIPTTSFVNVGTPTAPGTAQIGSYTFDVFAIDNTHLKLIQNDGLLVVSGDVFTQATSLPASSTLAFTMSGNGAAGPLALGGLIPLDASSQVASGGTEDYNDGGNVNTDTTFTGGFTALTGGRSTLALNGFVNFASNDVPGNFIFAAYPFTSNGATGVELLEIDGLGGVTLGTAYVQSGTSLAASQGFALNLSAFNLGNGSGTFEEDDIAEFSTTSSTFNGIVDFSDEGNQTFGQPFTGNYSAGVTGQYIASTTNAFNFNIYVVDSSTFLIMETDSNQIGTGVFEVQNASGSAAAQARVSVFHAPIQSHAARQKKR